ncbi:MAG: polymerase sigma 70 [Alphaproteobacteria bacterium]|jgi:RNA polymerase sigma-32 factor|nr:polymerase sigma 70 [Alphaproteobacteria bacterium]MDF3033827.1 polymerase sigma 70 [Alphaproteobacteria bacterium]
MKPLSSNANTQQADLDYIRQLMDQPLLKKDEEHDLALAWHDEHDEKALHLLVQAYMRLVVSTAVRFRHYGIALSDLIQEGNLGLMYAAERFDPEREVRFSTYARWWIRSHIQEFILRNWSIVRTGSTAAQKQLFFNLRRLKAQISKISTDQMTLEERNHIAQTLHVPLHEVEDMENRLASHDLSLSQPMNDTGSDDWMDSLADQNPDPEASAALNLDDSIRRLWIQGAMHSLSPRERMIITVRRLADHPTTLEDIGKRLKISKERVRQLEVRAIRKMRHHLLHNIQDLKEML